MTIYVLLGHQNPGSFCHAIAATAMEALRAAGHQVIYHDLYAEGFDPILPQVEVPREATLDPIVQRHCDEVVSADGYIIIHPNWWAMPPAILKGWLDRVWRQGVVYRFGPNGSEGLLEGRRAVVFTTSNTPREDEMRLFGDPLENLWKNCILSLAGINDSLRRNFESIIMSKPEDRAAWLAEVREIVSERFPPKG